MNSVSHTQERHIPVVQLPEFLVVLWGGFTISFICCCLRFLSRVRAFKKLLIDDYFLGLAGLLGLAAVVVGQIYASDMIHIVAVSAGQELPKANFPLIFERFLKASLALFFLFYSSLWVIKISFLLFFKRLGTNVMNQKLLWWPVFGFTLATYFVCIGTMYYSCLTGSFAKMIVECTKPSTMMTEKLVLKLNCAWDVISDFLIMLIPITMLWGVQMNWRRKAALVGIFSLVIIVMIFAIIRVAVVATENSMRSASWLLMWSVIENCVAIIVACLASFRSLFSKKTSRQPFQRHEPSHSSNFFFRRDRHRNRMRRMVDTLAAISDDIGLSYQVQNDGGHDRLIFDYQDDSQDRAIHHLSDLELVHARGTSDDDLVREASRVLPPVIEAAHVRGHAEIYEAAQV